MLQRISFSMETLKTMKITDEVDIDLGITFSTTSDQPGERYELRAVINHKGESIESGWCFLV